EESNLVEASRWVKPIAGNVLDVLAGLAPKSFELVLCLELIEHIYAGEELLARIYDVLTPGGSLVISTPNWLSLEGLAGFYFQIRRHERWTAWDSTHVRIYSSFELVRVLK